MAERNPARGFLLFVLAWATVFGGIVGVLLAPWVTWWAVLAGYLPSLAPLSILPRIFDGRLYPTAAMRVLVLRPFWYVQLALPFLAVAGILGALVGLAFRAPRLFGAWAVVGTASLYLLLALVGYWGSRRLVVRRYEASDPRLPAAFDGAVVAQLSDLHVGPHTPRGHVRRIVRAVQGAKPDLIAYTGDQVDDHDVDVAHFDRAFRELRAPLGAFAVAGNHDVYAGWDGVRAGLERMGVRVLVNEAVALERDGARLWVAGTGDPAGLSWPAEGGDKAAPDLARTLAGIPEDEYVLALAHNPALWPRLASRGVALTLSGHTHHGQISVGNWSLASAFLDLAMGSYQKDRATLYINPGTNFWGIPLRLGAWPEVTLVTLRRGAQGFRRLP